MTRRIVLVWLVCVLVGMTVNVTMAASRATNVPTSAVNGVGDLLIESITIKECAVGSEGQVIHDPCYLVCGFANCDQNWFCWLMCENCFPVLE